MRCTTFIIKHRAGSLIVGSLLTTLNYAWPKTQSEVVGFSTLLRLVVAALGVYLMCTASRYQHGNHMIDRIIRTLMPYRLVIVAIDIVLGIVLAVAFVLAGGMNDPYVWTWSRVLYAAANSLSAIALFLLFINWKEASLRKSSHNA